LRTEFYDKYDCIPLVACAKKSLLGVVFLGITIPVSTVFAASQEIPAWTYDSIMLLVNEGYMDMPEKPLEAYSKQELGKMVAQALVMFEKKRTGSVVDEYARISRLIVMDEVQLKLAKEQEKIAEIRVARARNRAAKDTELYVRRSMQGKNRLEIMNPLQEKSNGSLKKLEWAARDYAQAKSRVEQRSRMLLYAQERQEGLLNALNSGGALACEEKAGRGGSSYKDDGTSVSILDTVGKLRAEFLPELEKNGSIDNLNACQQLESNVPVEDIPDQRLKLDAEVRYDIGYSRGSYGSGSKSRIRARLYPDCAIDNNWHAKGMVEWEKTLNGKEYSNDGKLKVDRYYLSGNTGLVHADVGTFGSVMAEGNIYDSKFQGVRIQAGAPIKYNFEYGKAIVDDMDKSYDFSVSYKDAVYGVDAGYYHFRKKGEVSQSIYMGNYYHNLGLLDAGIMLLYGRDKGSSGKTGYVFTLGYTPQDSWKPHTYSSWLKYYHQSASTYISHTMNGRADNMRGNGGFKGWGLGINYNLPAAWTLGLEFYRLQDLQEGKRSNTVWFAVTKSFSNYTE